VKHVSHPDLLRADGVGAKRSLVVGPRTAKGVGGSLTSERSTRMGLGLARIRAADAQRLEQLAQQLVEASAQVLEADSGHGHADNVAVAIQMIMAGRTRGETISALTTALARLLSLTPSEQRLELAENIGRAALQQAHDTVHPTGPMN
jgi:hypothetical protein